VVAAAGALLGIATADRSRRRGATSGGTQLDGGGPPRDDFAMRLLPLVPFCAVAPLVLAPATGQVSATLVANTPMTVAWDMGGTWGSGANSLPAGPLLTDGSLVTTAPSPLGYVRLDWVVPPAGSASCSFRAARTTHSLPFTVSSADLSLLVSGPVGQRGHVAVVMLVVDDGRTANSVTVDVGDDGSIEATTQTTQWAYRREWRIPAVLGPNGLAIRIVHDDPFGTSGPINEWNVAVSFEPTSDAAMELGSSCGTNDVGWGWPFSSSFLADDHPYFLYAAPGGGGELCRLIARGHGPIAAFVVAMDPSRVAPGWLGVGLGCDDLLQNVAFTIEGDVTAPNTWEFAVPTLPPGLTFWVQHASFGPMWVSSLVPPVLRTGVSNLVRIDS